jgi:hypothetical protein
VDPSSVLRHDPTRDPLENANSRSLGHSPRSNHQERGGLSIGPPPENGIE